MRLKIDLSEAKPTICTKCKKKKQLFRHHKGNDGFLRLYNRQLYLDYFKYIDCVPLCNRCHMVIHFIYQPVVQNWGNFGSKGVLKLRLKLIDLCDLWLDGKIPNPEVTRIFKNQWQKSFKDWRRKHPYSQRKVAKDKSATF